MRPYGRRVWKNIPFQKYYFVSDISCKQLGEDYNFEGFCAPLRAQGLEIYDFKNVILKWIYHANRIKFGFSGFHMFGVSDVQGFRCSGFQISSQKMPLKQPFYVTQIFIT